jgi:hypothetical protein
MPGKLLSDFGELLSGSHLQASFQYGFRGHVIRLVQGHHMQMGMRNVKTRREKADFPGIEQLTLGLGQLVCQSQYCMLLLLAQIPEIGFVPPWNNERVARPDWPDIQKSHSQLVLQDEGTAGLINSDSAKGTGVHGWIRE